MAARPVKAFHGREILMNEEHNNQAEQDTLSKKSASADIRTPKLKKPVYGLTLGILITLCVVAISTGGGRSPERAEIIILAQDVALNVGDSPETEKAALQTSFSLSEGVGGEGGSAPVYKADEASRDLASKFANEAGEGGDLQDDGLGGYGVGRLYLQKSGIFGWVDGEAYSTRTLFCKPQTIGGPTTTAPDGMPCVPDDDSLEYNLPELEKADKMARKILKDVELESANKNGPYWNLEYSYLRDGAKITSLARAEVAGSGLASVTGVYTSFSRSGEYAYVGAEEALRDLGRGLMLAAYMPAPADTSGPVEIQRAELVHEAIWGEGGVVWCVPAWRFESKNGGVFKVYAINREYLRRPGSTSATDPGGDSSVGDE